MLLTDNVTIDIDPIERPKKKKKHCQLGKIKVIHLNLIAYRLQ